MLYSIGKYSSVMLAAGAKRALSSWENPFSFAARDNSYKFPAMIEFPLFLSLADGRELIVHKTQEPLEAGANPFALGNLKMLSALKASRCLDNALAEAVSTGPSGARGATSKKSRAKDRIYSFRML